MPAEGPDRSGFTEEIVFPEARGLGRLGRYELLALLGKGGMASVFLARLRGPSGFEKLLALKRIKPSLSEDARFVEMFLDEARVAAALQHPNVAQVFELGHEGSTYFLAMEYLHGEHLGAVLARAAERGARLPVDLACFIGVRVAEALHHAHEATDALGKPLSIIHRDVSPQNIFVTYAGDVKLTDFGVAKATSNVVETDTGAVKGKFAYMAPEQALGGPIDRRLDIFGLGIVLWEALSARRLFRADNDAQTLLRVTRCEVPSLMSERPEVGEAIDSIVHCALAKEPSGRFETAGAMARALSRQCSNVSAEDLRAWMRAHFGAEEERKRTFVTRAAEGTATVVTPDPVEEGTAGSGVVTRRLRSGATPPRASEAETVALVAKTAGIAGEPSTDAPRERRRAPLVIAALVTLSIAGVALAIWASGEPDDGASRVETPRAHSEPLPPTAVAANDPTPAPAPTPTPAPAVEAAPLPVASPERTVSSMSSERAARSAEERARPGTLEISIAPSHEGARYGWVQLGAERRTLPTVLRDVPAGPTWIQYQIGDEPVARRRVRVAPAVSTAIQLPR